MKVIKAAVFAALVLALIGIARADRAAAGTSPSATPTNAIFVANDFNVTAYPLGTTGNVAPVALATDLAGPSGVARDISGRIYVTNRGSNTVTIYPAGADGNTPPIAIIGGLSTKLSNPAGIVLDALGKIYVANAYPNSDSITVYPALGTSTGILNEIPVGFITGGKTMLDNPRGIALDSHQNIYVANASGGPVVKKQPYDVGSVTVYAAGSSGNVAPTATISGAKTGLAFPVGIAVDPVSGEIDVANYNTANSGKISKSVPSITVYAAGGNGNVAPTAIIAGSNTGLLASGGIAVDSAGNLYTEGCAGGPCFSINVYPPGSNGNVSPATTIAGADTGVEFPVAIAVDAARNLYVLNTDGGLIPGGSVTSYPASSSGNTAPTATIYSNFTGLFGASGVAVDSTGTIYVANAFVGDGGDIAVYPAGSYATGVAPVALIAGPDTGLSNPTGVAVDSIGDIFALNVNNVTEYPPGSTGDATPSASFSYTPGGSAFLTGITVNPNGRVYAVAGPSQKCKKGKCRQNGSGAVVVWPAGSNGSQKPNIVIAGANTSLTSPSAVAVDINGNIYVTNQGPLKCNAGCSCVPNGIGKIAVFAPGSKGNATPIFTIGGGSTGLTFPDGIAVDTNGNMYVSNRSAVVADCQSYATAPPQGGRSILVFASGSRANEAPSQDITGPYAGVNGPLGIAIGLANP